MEHLPLPLHSNRVKVPYLSNAEKYDGGDLHTYPDRAGWDVNTWRRQILKDTLKSDFILTSGRTVEETSAFLQTWLFFGLLSACLPQDVVEEDFVRADSNGTLFLTTERLENYVTFWKENAEPAPRDQYLDYAPYSQRLGYCNEAYCIVQVLDYYCRNTSDLPKPELECIQQRLFSIWMLEHTLLTATRSVYYPGVWCNHPSATPKRLESERDSSEMPSWLEKKFVRAGWCPSTIRMLKLNYEVDGQAFAYALGSQRLQQSHEQCTSTRCVSRRLRAGESTMHRTDHCDCDPIRVDLEALVSILQRKGIPVFRIRLGKDRKAHLEIERMADVEGYVAISHVWADGLCNPHENSLPACQIEHLFGTLRSVKDCLIPPLQDGSLDSEASCTPPFWFDGLCIPVQKEHQALRDFSIAQMHRIYRDATAIMVLDPDFGLLRADASKAEILMRTLLSGWSTRLWCYQEGALNLNTAIVGADCAFDLGACTIRPNDERLCFVLDRGLQIRTYRDIMLANLRQPSKPVRVIERLIAAMSRRITSRADDEAIVMATSLGYDVEPLLTEPSTERRMIIFLSGLPSIPPNLLFAWGPRLDIDGWRWVPQTLLAPYGVHNLIVDKDIATSFNQPEQKIPLPASYVHPAPSYGLATFFPLIHIGNVRRWLNKGSYHPFFTVCTDFGDFFIFDAAYGCPRLPSAELTENPWLHAIILESCDLPQLQYQPTLLVTVSNEQSGSDPSHPERSFLRVHTKRMVLVTSRWGAYGTDAYPPEANHLQFDGKLMQPRWLLVSPAKDTSTET